MDRITFFNRNRQIQVDLPREKLYEIDREFWQMIVDPGSMGFLSEKQLEIIEYEDLDVSINVVKKLVGYPSDLCERYSDYLPALIFLKRMRGSAVELLCQQIYGKFIKSMGIFDALDTPFEDLVPDQSYRRLCKYLNCKRIMEIGWEKFFNRKYILEYIGYKEQIFVVLKAFEAGIISRIPFDSWQSEDFWLYTSPSIHPYMWQSRKYEGQMIKYMYNDSIVAEINQHHQKLHKLIVPKLEYKDITTIIHTMHTFLQQLQQPSEEWSQTLDTIIKIAECKYESLSEDEVQYILHMNVDPREYITTLPLLDDNQLRHALMNPLSYIQHQ